MIGMNSVMLLGDLKDPPKAHHKDDGTVIVNLFMSTISEYEGEERKTWHRVVCFGKVAERCAKMDLKAGARIAVLGSIRNSSYEKNGQKVYRTEINARDIVPQVELATKKKQSRDEDDFQFNEQPF